MSELAPIFIWKGKAYHNLDSLVQTLENQCHLDHRFGDTMRETLVLFYDDSRPAVELTHVMREFNLKAVKTLPDHSLSPVEHLNEFELWGMFYRSELKALLSELL